MWIELSEFNIKIFLPLIYPIVKRIEDIPRKAYLNDDNQLFKTFRYFLCYTLSFVPFLVIKLRTKKKRKKKEPEDSKPLKIIYANGNDSVNSKSEINKLSKKLNKKRLIKNIIILILLCVLGGFCYFYRYLFEVKAYEIPKQSVGIFFIIFDFIALSYFVLKQKLYKHHFVFSGIIAFILLILFIITVFYMKSEDIFPSFLYFLVLYFCFGVYDVFGKKYMNEFYQTPYFLMFVVGTINSFALLIFDLFIYFVDSDIKGTIIGFQNNVYSVSRIFIFIGDIILQWVWNVGIWLTIYYLTPCHYFMSEYISEYIYYIVNAMNSDSDFYSTTNIIIFSIAFCINFFCCLVFNEVIIINSFGLDYNTKKRIQERESKDVDQIVITELEEQFDKEEVEENE